MIQRIQTIHLICAAIIGVVSAIIEVCHPFLSDADGISKFVSYAYTTILFLGSIVSVRSIFMYKNRSLQMKTVALGCVVFVFSYAFVLIFTALGTTKSPWQNVTFYLPALCVCFNILAHKRIRYDDDLVRSADRLR